MPIYNIFDGKTHKVEPEVQKPHVEPLPPLEKNQEKEKWFSSVLARSFFLLLLLADIGWLAYALFRMCAWGALSLFFYGKLDFFKDKANHAIASVKRSLICGVSLFLALFSPSFGIMIACTYFLMYDPSGIEEVVPASLQSQFKEFFP